MIRIQCFVLALCSATALGADWPQWRGLNRDGLAPQSPPLAASCAKDGPKTLWQSDEIPCGVAGGFSSPVIANGRVYVFYYVAKPAPEACVDGFCCLNAESGKTVWKKEFTDLEK